MSQVSLFLNQINSVSSYGLQPPHKIDLTVLENLIHSEQEEIKHFIKEQKIRYDFDKKNIHLKYILERDGEYEEKNRIIKKFIAHIWISHDFFTKILNHINILIDKRSHVNDDKIIVEIDTKIKALLNYLDIITREYEHYVASYDIQKSILSGGTGDLPSWFINIPEPDNLYMFIDNLFYYHENGNLAVPLLRSYFEIKYYPHLENIINQIRKATNNTDNYKVISFTKEFGLEDFIFWCRYLTLLDDFTIDLFSRFYQYLSSSIHNGMFFDRIIAHQVLYFLQDITLKNCDKIPSDFDLQVQRYLKEKFSLEHDDPVSRYNKFQPPSNKRIRVQ